MAKKGIYKVKNSSGTYDDIYLKTSSDMVIEANDKLFVSQAEKNTWNGKANSSHNHTSLTGITSLAFKTESSDRASISTVIDGASTYFDFNLADDASQSDQWRWRFSPSGGSLFDAMILNPISLTNAELKVKGEIYSNGNKVYHTGNKPTLADIGAAASSHSHDKTALTNAYKHTYKTLSSSADLNEIYEPGLYTSDSDGNSANILNRPPGTNGFILEVHCIWGSGLSGRQIQYAYMRNSSDIYARWKSENSSWSSWTLKTLSIGTGAGNAAAGNHTHSYLPLSGGTLTGKVTTPGLTTSAVISDSRITTGNQQLINANTNTIYVGNPGTQLNIESNANPSVKIGSNSYILYHTGNKPSASDVGAAAFNHNHNGTYVYDKANSSGNMNNVAGYRNALGMINLTGTDTTINPNGQTGWHHFINMSYIETSGTNMWQTQIANKAGSTDLWVRSRSGGEIKDGTAWGAPWTRILTGSNYKNVVTPANIGAAASNHAHNYLPLSGGTLTGTVKTSAEIQSTSANALRMIYGNYGAMLRMDNNNVYFLLTNSGDQYGSFNNLRPFYINNATGMVTMSNGLTANLTGNASSATKLQTPRTIALSGDATGSVSFDGQSNVSINAKIREVAYVGSDTDQTQGWYKVASGTMSGYGNTNATFAITSTYSRYASGILQLQIRSDNTSINCPKLIWLTRCGFNEGDVIININGMTWTMYVQQTVTRYGRVVFEVLSKSSINNKGVTLNLADNNTKETSTPVATKTSSDGGTVYAAKQLATARTINGVSFNGTSNITIYDNSKLPLSGGTISSSSFGPVFVERLSASHGASIGFKNSNGVLGYVGMSGTVNSGLMRWSADTNNSYTILDTGNYKSTITPANIGAVNKAGDTMTGQLTITKSGDGATLLDLNAERGWCFQQGGSGTDATLDLVSKTNDKSFRILDASKKYGMAVYTSSTGTSVSIDGNKVYHAGAKPTASEIGAAASNHTHSYLPLSGGTMTGSVSSSLTTGTHLDGNKGKAIINSTAAGSGYTMLAKMNSTNGVWTMGGWGTNFCLFYTAKSTINAGTNSFTKQLKLLDEAGNSQFPGDVYATKVVVNAVDMGSSGGGMTTNIGSISIKGNSGGNFHMTNESSSNSSSGSIFMRTNGNVYIRNKNNDSQSGMLRVNSIGGDGGYINLGGTLSSKTIYPDTNNAYDIGSSSMCYSKVYTNHIQGYMVTGKSGRRFTIVPTVSSDGVMEVGRVIDFHGANGCTKDFGARIEFADSTTANSRGIVFSREITPANNATQDIGTAGGRWRNIYLINSPNVSSKRELKTNINLFDDKNAYDNIKNLNIYTYNFKKLDEDGNWNGECEAENMLGSILDELPIECINEEAEGVDLYAYTSYAISALKHAIQKIEKLEKELSELKK